MAGMSGGLKRLYLARPRGFCAGVVMAIEAVERWAEALKDRGEVVVYHEIVHNRVVVDRLRAKGVHFVEDLEEVRRLQAARPLAGTLIFSAHGHPPQVRRQAAEMGLSILDATCPLVTKVHTEARRYAQEGYWILLIGDSADHQEIKGTYGEAPDRTILVAVHTHVGKDPRLADPRTVEVPDPERVVVLTQTTLSVDDTLATIALLKARFPKLVVPARKDLCYATQNRQEAVKRIAPHVDVFLVLTSPHSSNGMRLLELAESLVGRAYRLETAKDLKEAWLQGAESVGVTSAASTPEDLVEELVALLRARNPGLEVIEEGEWEEIAFREPRLLAPEEVLGGV
ncbi:MAG: 4-hydroxy-3-methylbut-2-enyl diphosphate reductase [Thermus sp.]|uniref:4-hydroxy-3-methylbut-2-enyl diphosphate reductase n=1 Tax=Thermus sp. TaxID=275 RepID=UPI0025DF5322|nr:4-hydroxy-3-methylbut-2-enyl diphosphate reductase [Thermus sp.]MCS6867949.1 4-hydroxy-3-methylbut-2-enyl diphosphate reductase [Thermus sp.]MCS7218858.1 4-hydroxy-3-methylbut-2-enyl diphosphate reductase [Thermus sp.]MCX7850674.1 4-hydroxy-3-methylbut-2-enyl diphosphate reductase [Thermus sp.]MDW8017627.1 4-hydroxy-3-methylbut-2-enyl diphosphate reductase [Thermus sp.]MDW8356654.1 4-hydroxy-3-methylbut-2-enyl diphosphate reductase [Thermus sp.]